MSSSVAPRIYCIPASEAPLVAVFRRGPADWWQVGLWALDPPAFEAGAWFKGRLYPRRCDLSPDGRWLAYFALKANTRWSVGDSYYAISRAPWLSALAAWRMDGTWTRGFRFVADRGLWQIGEPSHGDDRACRARYGLAALLPLQFAAERARGWRETSDCPPRDLKDLWDQRRNARLCKPQPRGGNTLVVESRGWPGGQWTEQAIEGLAVSYWLEGSNDLQPLDDLQWADWHADGRLLAVTRSGKVQIRDLGRAVAEVVHEVDLAAMQPDPEPAPAWASSW